jgi:hypothetical protein
MGNVLAFLSPLIEDPQLRWIGIGILVCIAVYFVWTTSARNHMSIRKQLDNRFDALLTAQATFSNEWQERYEETRELLEREREYGKQQDAKNTELMMKIAEMRGELNVLKQQVGMFLSCPSSDCPFKSIRDTLG